MRLTPVERALQAVDADANLAPVGLDLGLARPPHEAEAAALAFQVGPGPHQAAPLVAKGGEFDLEPALTGAGPCREDFEDQCSAVDDLAVPRAFEIALLDRGERPIHDDQSEFMRRHDVRHRLHAPRTEEGGRPRLLHGHDIGLTTSRSMAWARLTASARRLSGSRARSRAFPPPAGEPAPDAGRRCAVAN